MRSGPLQIVPEFVTKIIQAFDCKVARHGNMLVGRTGSGKSEAWKCLQRALGRLRKEEPDDDRYQKVGLIAVGLRTIGPNAALTCELLLSWERRYALRNHSWNPLHTLVGVQVHVHTINPLALSNDELYGCFEAATHEWHDGVLARIMRTVCKDEAPDQKWILFDGPVDTLWIESMNTTLDDNKLLTLLSGACLAPALLASIQSTVLFVFHSSDCTVGCPSYLFLLTPRYVRDSTPAGERIAMTPQVSLLFEVEDLSQASPATVSRAGMIYLNVEDLGWRPFITSWLAAKAAAPGGDPAVVDTVSKLVDKYMEPALEHKRLHCRCVLGEL